MMSSLEGLVAIKTILVAPPVAKENSASDYTSSSFFTMIEPSKIDVFEDLFLCYGGNYDFK